MKIQPGSHLLFVGDSVTDCERLRPVGAGLGRALGTGYVAKIALHIAPPAGSAALRITNMGVSGNTVRDLAGRWDRDVLALKPDWLAVMIGINDVWRQFDGADRTAAVGPTEFAQTYGRLMARAQPLLQGMVILSPFYVQARRDDPMRLRVDEYGLLAKAVAQRCGAVFVDVQGAVDAALKIMRFTAIAADRVHPTSEGHALIAQAFLAAVESVPKTA